MLYTSILHIPLFLSQLYQLYLIQSTILFNLSETLSGILHHLQQISVSLCRVQASPYSFLPGWLIGMAEIPLVILSSDTKYNEFTPRNYPLPQIQIHMDFEFDFWDASYSHHSQNSAHLFFEPDSPQELLPVRHTIPPEAHMDTTTGPLDRPNNKRVSTEPEEKPAPSEGVGRLVITKMGGNNRSGASQKRRRRKNIKPSPYHNYQKHLNTTLRQLITFPPPEGNAAPAEVVAHRLWDIFMRNESATKKILHFIFNEFNEYRIKEEELRLFGFEAVYSECPPPLLAEAKTLLTHLVLQQLNDENVDGYLQTRRIKNQVKFKRYLMTFRRELQDGFLKKRFTNRSRKEQMKREMGHDDTP